jgi:Holliday junction resolvase RusA-like endonuclease
MIKDEKDCDRTSNTFANLEQDFRNEPLAKDGGTTFDSLVCIEIISYRKRLADVDGISAKAVIDGLVKAKILEDDSTKFVEEIRYKQIKSTHEKTIIIIRECE